MDTYHRALTIAGSDSGGGAGIQADLKTFSALGCFGTSAITALTAQNTLGVAAVHPVPPAFIAAQIDAVLDDIGTDATKIGMVHSGEAVEAVADRLRAHHTGPVVVDPVMVAASGDRLLREDAVEAMRRHLLPLASVLTPNVEEAAVLLDTEPIRSRAEMEDTCRALADLGPRAVLSKAGTWRARALSTCCTTGRPTRSWSSTAPASTLPTPTGPVAPCPRHWRRIWPGGRACRQLPG